MLALVVEGGPGELVLAGEVDAPVAVDVIVAGGVADGEVAVGRLFLRGKEIGWDI